MANTPQTPKHYTLDIHLLDLVVMLFRGWKVTAVYLLVAAIIGVVVAFSIPRVYRSSVTLAPEEAQSALGGNVSSLASMVGLDMKLGTNDAIYPEIYPDMMHSTEFVVGLFDTPVETLDGSVKTDYRTYLTKHQKFAFWEVPINWMLRKLRGEPAGARKASDAPVDPTHLTLDEDNIAKAVDQSVRCQVDKKTDVITITVEAQDPLVAKTVVDSATSRLQQSVTDYRTRKARADLAYLEQIYDEAQAQYEAARKKYASASTARQDVVLESARSDVKALEDDMQLKLSIYTQVAEQRQLAEANVQKMTPAFTVIQNSTVPVKHANKPKVLILAVFLFLGLLMRLVVMLCKYRAHFVREEESPQAN